MKHLKLKPVLNFVKKYFPIILIIAFALFTRFYMLEKRTGFDADQEEIAFKAKELLNGNPVLLGPKTSLGGFSIGPGFTYLWAIFSFIFRGNPVSGAYLSVTLGIIFIALLYKITRNIFSDKVGLFLTLITAISISIIQWDQTPWAPSLFYLSELIIFYGAYISNENKYGLPLLAFGIAMGFQSHFAVFLLIFPLVIFLYFYRPVVDRSNLIWSLAILFFGFAPVILFDLTHQFVNFYRLLSIFSLGISGVGPEQGKIFVTLVSNSDSIIWLHFPLVIRFMIFTAFIFVSFWGIYNNREHRKLLILSNLILIIPFFIFLFYRSNFSEYYLMTVVVPFIFILGFAIHLLNNKYLIITIFAVILALNIKSFLEVKEPFNLYAKEQIVQKIISLGGKSGYGVSLSTEAGYNFGYSYLFSYYKANPDIPPLPEQKEVFTIIVPAGFGGLSSSFTIDGVGLRWEGVR